MDKGMTTFLKRLERHHDELRWLYMELYDNDSMFAELCDRMRQFYLETAEWQSRTGTGKTICWE